MYFNETCLNCSSCNQEYNIPKILPCGESICSDCILPTDKDSNEMRCVCCNRVHSIPNEGFPLNKSLIKVIQSKSQDSYRGSIYENLKSYLEEIDSDIKEFNNNLRNGEEVIRDHCKSLINEIDLTTECLIQEIHKSRDDLINQVKLYENTCLESFRNESKLKQKFEIFATEVLNFEQKYKSHIKKIDLNENELLNGIDLARNFKRKMIKEKIELFNALFNSKYIQFKKSDLQISVKNIGILNNVKKIEFDNLKIINLSNLLASNPRKGTLIRFGILSNGNFVIVYLNDFLVIEIHKIDLNDQKRLHSLQINDINDPICSDICTHKNKIILTEAYSKTIKIYDENLTEEASKSFTRAIKSVAGTDKMILCLVQSDWKSGTHLNIYDWNLQLLTISDRNSSYFYLPELTTNLYSSDHHYIFRHEDKLSIISQRDGSLTKTFGFSDQTPIVIDSARNLIISVDYKMQNVSYIDFDGNIVDKQDLINFKIENLNFHFNPYEKKLFFCNIANYSIYLND